MSQLLSHWVSQAKWTLCYPCPKHVTRRGCWAGHKYPCGGGHGHQVVVPRGKLPATLRDPVLERQLPMPFSRGLHFKKGQGRILHGEAGAEALLRVLTLHGRAGALTPRRGSRWGPLPGAYISQKGRCVRSNEGQSLTPSARCLHSKDEQALKLSPGANTLYRQVVLFLFFEMLNTRLRFLSTKFDKVFIDFRLIPS